MTAPRANGSHPLNILWISLEDTSPRFGCYGDTVARTPNIDRLAAEGCRFPNAFSTAGVCAPSRSAIITGMYPVSIGSHHMRTTHTNRATPEMPTPYEVVPPHYVKEFPEYLRGAGYYCTNNEKTDYQFSPSLTAWDECGPEGHWRNREGDQPFFAVFNPTLTHESGMWPKEGESIETDPGAVTLPPFLPDTPKTRLALARHYDNIARSDTLVGKILAQLEEDGLTDSTIVVLWSDHGEGLPRAKRWLYDSGIRIPMIVRWPARLDPGSIREQLVSLVDLGPTMLSVAGVPVPAHMQGQAFLGSQRKDPRRHVFAARDRFDVAYDMVRAVRDRQFKYIRNFQPEQPYLLWIPYRNRHPIMQEIWRLHGEGKLEGAQRLLLQQQRPVEELYDTENDPFEIQNLADDPAHRARLEDMRKVMNKWRRRVKDMGDLPEAEMVRGWWPDGVQPTTSAPVVIPISPSLPGIEPARDSLETEGPLHIQLHCATQGASMAYTTETGDSPKWRLYSGLIPIAPGGSILRARANRLGHKPSDEIKIELTAL
ncbi:MAG: sulfatase [Verrucomicrobia bacterium]|nr:MAG: sulfatase [Verrucomicrobiota bacterium]